MILLIDNYDSFVYNLARYFQRLGQPTRVVRNDAVSIGQIAAMQPAAIVLSPGPCWPTEAGCCLEVVRRFWPSVPMLGVCLGHQAIFAALGGQIVPAPEPVHGRTSEVYHDGRGVFAGAVQPLVACRYHSLMVDQRTLPEALEITAHTADGVPMALRHREKPVVGLQFHPESILTDEGYPLLKRFLQLAEIDCRGAMPSIDDERRPTARLQPPLPREPVTF